MAQTKAQAIAALKATAKYKKAPPALKQKLRQREAKKWSGSQVKNFDAETMAGKYQYSRALLEATPELLATFKAAHLGEWSDDKIRAAIENTSWYRDHAVRWKEVEQSRQKNPAEFNHALDKARYNVTLAAKQLGSTVSPDELELLASDAVYGKWDESDFRRYVSTEVDIGVTGGLFGEAGEAELGLRKLAAEHGVEYSDAWFKKNAKDSITYNSRGDVELQMRTDSANTYSQYATGILAGTQTISKASGPYLRSLERTYGLEDGTASVFDTNVRKALLDRDEQGTPRTRPLWQFEEDLRRDPKWLTTNAGAETMANVAGGVLQEWGFLNNG